MDKHSKSGSHLTHTFLQSSSWGSQSCQTSYRLVRSRPMGDGVAVNIPDAGDILDLLLKRSETEDWDSVSFSSFFPFFSTLTLMKKHAGLSLLTFAFGILVVYSMFHINGTPPAFNNKTSPSIYHPRTLTLNPRKTRSVARNLAMAFCTQIDLRTILCCSCPLLSRPCSFSSIGTIL